MDFCECNFGLWDAGIWAVSSWLRIGTGGGHLCMGWIELAQDRDRWRALGYGLDRAGSG